MRRASGEVGAVTGESPSSTALSSNVDEAEPVPALETLSRREAPAAKGDVWVGEPDRPRVEMDMRRPVCVLAAAEAIGPGKAEVPVALVGERPKMLVKGCPGEKEARRSRDVAMAGVDGVMLSPDMMTWTGVLVGGMVFNEQCSLLLGVL